MPLLNAPLMTKGSLARGAQPVLRAEGGLRLRSWHAGDVPALCEVFKDPSIQRWHGRRLDGEGEAAEWIEKWRAHWPAETAVNWAVVDDESDVLLGRMSLKRFVFMSGQAEAAYWTAPWARGGGAAPRALRAVSDWALGQAGFHRLELVHSVVNEPSCRVAEKCGYALEGTRRRSLLHHDGLHDMHLHARLREE